MTRERGSTTVEVVILTPVLMVLVLLVVYLGRYTAAMQTTQQAADHAARSASKSSFAAMQTVATTSAVKYLDNSRGGCGEVQVNVAVDRENLRPSVLVEIECVVDDSGLNLLGLMPRRVHAESLEVIDVWRAEE